MKKITWLSGWSLPTNWLLDSVQRQFPNFQHVCIHPSPTAVQQAIDSKYDHLVGISLGTALIFDSIQTLGNPNKISLITPFVDFKKESEKGGKIHSTQMKFLLKLLESNTLAAINDFYKQAKIPLALETLPYSKEDLLWGIEFLINYSTANSNFPFHQVLLGENDPLLNSEKISQHIPNSTIIKEIGHEVLPYLSHLNFNH